MVITYDKFVEISINIDRKTLFLNEPALTILYGLKKKLNISIKEVLKKTQVNKKEDIGQIFKLLNKITDKNYEKMKVELFEIIKK